MFRQRLRSSASQRLNTNDGTANRVNLDGLFRFAQILAIVGAGIWTLLNYFSFSRDQQHLENEHQRLTNDQLRLAVAQQTLLSKAEQERARVTLDQQKFDLQMKRLVADFERDDKKLSVMQRELALQQAQATSAVEVLRARLATEALTLENRLKGFAVREATEGRVRLTSNLEIERLAENNTYQANFDLKIENTSKARVEVSWTRFEWYIGHISGDLPEDGIARANGPPIFGLVDRGPIEWSYRGSKTYTYPNSKLLRMDLSFLEDHQSGGGATKSLAPDDFSHYGMPLVIRAGADRWLGVVVLIGIDGGVSGENAFYESHWLDLRTATEKDVHMQAVADSSLSAKTTRWNAADNH